MPAIEQKKRILTAILILACTAQLFFIFKRVHNYPFVIFDMYSRPENARDRSIQYLVIADADTLYPADFPILAEGRLLQNIRMYDRIQQTGAEYWDEALRSRLSEYLPDNTLGDRLRSWSDRKLRQDTDAVGTFPTWLGSLVAHKLGRPIGHIRVVRATYSKNQDRTVESRTVIDTEL